MASHLDHGYEVMDGEGEGGKAVPFFVEGGDNSGSEFEFSTGHWNEPKRARRCSGAGSPLLVLAFSHPTWRDPECSSPSSPASSVLLPPNEDQGGHRHNEPIEEWMILGGEAQEGDADIQLNLRYWSSCHEDSGSDDDHSWAVVEKDKVQPFSRYFCTRRRPPSCHKCNKNGHLAKACPNPKKPTTCVLCGIMGHRQRSCPSRHCSSCGFPPHGHRPCLQRPVWNQHCRRCGMTGHVSDACPDTWRQYHLTVKVEAPLRPQTDHALKDAGRCAHCYNCSERGHHGHECTKKKMSGTFPSVPYICHYDREEEILQRSVGMQARAEELSNTCLLPLSERQQCAAPLLEDKWVARGDASTWRRDQRALASKARTKTCLDRRRERREAKKRRREAQARRGGLPARSDDEAYPADPSKTRPTDRARAPPAPPKRSRTNTDACGARSGGSSRSRKSREAERWKKRGGMRRGYLYPRGDLGMVDENLLSPKHRVRHRRR